VGVREDDESFGPLGRALLGGGAVEEGARGGKRHSSSRVAAAVAAARKRRARWWWRAGSSNSSVRRQPRGCSLSSRWEERVKGSMIGGSAITSCGYARASP
jgi:hypothetical protein